MKKYLLLLLLFVCPLTAFAQEKVSVKSITMDEKSDAVVENSPAEAEGLNINVDVKFTNVGDTIKYKVEVENLDNEDYQLNTGKDFTTSEYIKYVYSFDNDSNILKANSTKTMYVTLTYDKEVPEEATVNGTYTEDNDMTIGVLREEDNPHTGRDELFVIGVVLAFVILIGLIMAKHRSTKYLVLLLGSVLLIPTVSALKEVNITMNTKIEIETYKEFCVNNWTATAVKSVSELTLKYYRYTPGMTFADYYEANEDFTYRINTFLLGGYEAYDTCFNEGRPKEECAALKVDVLLDDQIRPKEEGCYDYWALVREDAAYR